MRGEFPPEMITALEVASANNHVISDQRTALLQKMSLVQEYRDTLEELEQVTSMAETIVDSPIVVQDLQHLQVNLIS
jgi:hypothetical protein